ncbi:WhiB family transcriptional regulator [Streptomyces olivoreticuli]
MQARSRPGRAWPVRSRWPRVLRGVQGPSTPEGIVTASHYAPDTLERAGSWQDRSFCTRPEVDGRWWHSDMPDELEMARQWCRHCPVLQQCLDSTMAAEGNAPVRGRFGIFGGLNGKERYALYASGTAPQRGSRNVGGRPRSAPCGSESAYQCHLKHGEPIDEECRQAHNTHAAKYRARARK